MPSAATISGGFRSRSIGSRRMTSATRAKSSARSCRASPSSPPFSNRIPIPHARRQHWHLLLEGDRGCIVWWSEDCIDWKSADYALTPKARALAPALREMTAPLARLFLRAERIRDPIFIHYSQPSVQVDWLLESTADGSTWLRRFSSFEADHNRQARVRNAWLKAFQDLGFAPQFISSAEIEAGRLKSLADAALILSGSHTRSGP